MMRIRIDKTKWKKLGDTVSRLFRRVLFPAFLVFLCFSVLFGSMALILGAAMCDKTRDRIVTTEALLASDVEFDCILVLGCRVFSDGTPSPMLSDRVVTAVSVYNTGVCSRLLMSGDHKDSTYNEVDPMRREAESLGVPSDAIEADPLGLSTYDSIMRFAAEHPGARVIIVTQSYHLYRALYLAERAGLDAYGVSADLRPYRERFKHELREVVARCKDIYYAEKKPAFAGQA